MPLLTRGVAKHILSNKNIKEDYENKYKGIRQCYKLLRFSINGLYVNFGVFRLYGDQIMDRCLQAIFDLFLHIPIGTVMVSLLYL